MPPGVETRGARDGGGDAFQGDDERVFCHPQRGTVYRAEWFETALRAALRAAGVEGHVRAFHYLRHTSIANDAAAGANPVALMTKAGHSDMKTTRIYLHLAGGSCSATRPCGWRIDSSAESLPRVSTRLSESEPTERDPVGAAMRVREPGDGDRENQLFEGRSRAPISSSGWDSLRGRSGAMPSQDRFNVLLERLDADGEFAGALELDTLTTLRDMGFDDLIETAEQERDRIGELVDRIYRDDAFRQAVEQDPLGELGEWGIPDMAIAPVLVLAGAPDDVVEQATADVEAHLLGKKPATLAAMGAILGTLAFAQQATAAQPQATTQVNPAAQAQVTPAAQTQVSPAAQAQVSPAAQTQVNPAAQTQVNPATKAQVNPAAKAQVSPAVEAQVSQGQRKRWQGVQANRLKSQSFSLLRARGL